MTRTLFAQFDIGSTMFGTRTPESDNDRLFLWYPRLTELVDNRHVTISQVLEGDNDSQHLLLGDFVMGLGNSLDNSLIAFTHSDTFGDLEEYWLTEEFFSKLLKTGSDMWNFNPDKPKIRAHAFRYWNAYIHFHNAGWQAPLYPMSERNRETYLSIRNGSQMGLDWHPTVSLRSQHPSRIDKNALAEWVWDKYTNHYEENKV